jgi:hypothetical protein
VDKTSNTVLHISSVESILLGLGLALRDYHNAHFTDPDELPSDFPAYAQDTTIFGYNAIIAALGIVNDDIQKYVDLYHIVTKSLNMLSDWKNIHQAPKLFWTLLESLLLSNNSVLNLGLTTSQ